jgi:DNA-binding transcriptional LysR family regulator
MVRKALLGQLSDVDIRLLRIFKVISESGGFSAAELELNIGRSTISRHIKDLETRLGVSLCYRGRSGFGLTAEGKVVYDATLRLLASINEFRSELAELHENMTGKLVIALFDKTVTNPQCLTYKAIAKFDDIAPNVKIEIHVDTMHNIEQGVMEGRYHIGIIPYHRPSSSLSYANLFEEKMYLYCGQEHPLFAMPNSSHENILAQKYAGLGYHSPNMENGLKLGWERSATVYDQEVLVCLLQSGKYIGYLPDHYAQSFVENGQIRAIASQDFHYVCKYMAMTRLAPKPSRVVDTFLQLLNQVHDKQ